MVLIMGQQRQWLDTPGVQVAPEDGGDILVFASWAAAGEYVASQGIPGLLPNVQSFGGPPRGIIWTDGAAKRQFVGFSHDLIV